MNQVVSTASIGVLALAALCITEKSFAQALPDPMDPPPSVPEGKNPLEPEKPTSSRPGRRPAASPGGDRRRNAEDLVQVRCVADVDSITPGRTFHIAVIFDIEPDWHIYWKNSGASGAPTEIAVNAPAGFTIGPTLFPRPEKHEETDGITYGYETRTILFVPITPEADAASSSAMFTLDIDWLVCKELCLKGHADETISVGVPEGELPDPTRDPSANARSLAKAAFNRLPKPLAQAPGQKIEFDGETLTITLAAQGRSTGEVYPNETPGVTYGDEHTVTVEEDVMTITVPVDVEPGNARGRDMTIQGLVVLGDDPTDPSYEFSIPVPGPSEPADGVKRSVLMHRRDVSVPVGRA